MNSLEEQGLLEQPRDRAHLLPGHQHGRFNSFAELRATFPSVDKVGERYVFNIGGNKYRLVAAIAYTPQVLWIKAVLTHAEYDKGAWK